MTNAAPRVPDIAIIGLGVIGGSAALRLHERGTALQGFTRNERDREAAAAAGIPVARTLEEAVHDVGLVLIAVPLDALGAVAGAVVRAAPPHATILHAGSLQHAEALGFTPAIAARVTGTHPMAGSHRSGFAGAAPDLFRGATVYVDRRAAPRQREDAEMFWSMAGASRIEYLDTHTHDGAMSWSSHLPHLAASALALAMARGRAHDAAVPPGPGGRGATRLAMSAWEMWQPILARAPEATVSALRALEGTIAAMREALERQDWEALHADWEAAARWRAALESES